MGDMRIESFVSPEAIPELQEALAAMKLLAKEILDLNKAMKSGETGLGQAKSIAQIAAMQEALAAQNKQLTDSFNKLTEAVANYQKKASTTVKTPAQKLAEQVKKDRAEAEKAQKAADKKYEDDFNKLLAAEKKAKDKAAKDDLDRIKATQKAKSDAQKLDKKEAADKAKFEKQLNTAQAREIRQVNAAQSAADKKKAADRKAAEAQALKDAKIAEDLADSYKQLSLAYAAAALKAKQLQINMGAEHPTAVQATKDAQALGAELKRLDASVGQYGRNVGNYSDATKGLRGSLGQIARELPSMGNGFQTFASAIGNNIDPAREAFAKFREEQAQFRKEGKATTSVWKAIGSAIFSWQMLLLVGVTLLTTYSKEIEKFGKRMFGISAAMTDVEIAQKGINDAFDSGELKSAVTEVKQLEYYFGLYARGLMTGKETLDAYNDSMGTRLGFETDVNSARDAYMKKAPDYIKLLQLEAEANAILAEEAKNSLDIDRLKRLKELREDKDIPRSAWQKLKDWWQDPEQVKDMTDAFNEENRLMLRKQKLDKEVEQQRAKVGASVTPQKQEKEKKEKKAKKPEDLFKEQLDAELKYLKKKGDAAQEVAEREMEFQSGIAENESRRWEERLTAYKEFAAAKTRVAQQAVQTEIDLVQHQIEAIRKIEAKDPSKRSDEEKDLLRNKMALYQELDALLEKQKTDELKATQDGDKVILKATEDNDKAVVASMKARVDEIRRLLAQQKKDEDDALNLAIKRFKERQGIQDDYLNAAASTNEIATTIADAFTNARIASIDREMSKLNERTELEIKNIELSTASEAEKAEKIALLRAETAAKEKEMLAEKNAVAKRTAVFAKALNVSATIINTAAAIMAIWNDPTPIPAPVRLASSIAVGAAGALQIAKIVATPIPEYEEGTGDEPHGGGPARLFEGNKAEMVFEKGRKPWVGDKEGIYQLSKGAEVISNEDLMAAASAYALGTASAVKAKAEAQGSGLVVGMEKVVKAIEDKPVSNFEVTGRGISQFVNAGNAHLELERNLRR